MSGASKPPIIENDDKIEEFQLMGRGWSRGSLFLFLDYVHSL